MKPQVACSLCQKIIPVTGYRLRIYNINFCPSCEDALTNISVNDVKYDVYKNSLKKLLFG